MDTDPRLFAAAACFQPSWNPLPLRANRAANYVRLLAQCTLVHLARILSICTALHPGKKPRTDVDGQIVKTSKTPRVKVSRKGPLLIRTVVKEMTVVAS
jgi:hypothetical protein